VTFQYLLVAVLVGFAIFLVRLPGLGRGRKAAILVLVAAMLVFSIWPEWSTNAAKLVGISRGVDLLFYISHLVLFLLAFVFFLKLKKMEMRMTMLVRQLALEPGRAERQGRSARKGPSPGG
jgi:hypothetical protein